MGTMIKPGEFEEIILEKNLTNEEIAALTSSDVRSVYRWRAHGIPSAKFELFKLALEAQRA